MYGKFEYAEFETYVIRLRVTVVSSYFKSVHTASCSVDRYGCGSFRSLGNDVDICFRIIICAYGEPPVCHVPLRIIILRVAAHT
ncbi:hypothetical protein PILCRDRAFT_377668 [Piloderma croceum F 1598]|uniref:Uncharacterized protein n=1 Tax=Piloderma croceum (strain F 1598) TaxID=765440 RepID=A0A0C3FZ39_PILCF|nr:hypothetical protein PILCRDRAFT_377668 [Piloderma croceum F 1598]